MKCCFITHSFGNLGFVHQFKVQEFFHSECSFVFKYRYLSILRFILFKYVLFRELTKKKRSNWGKGNETKQKIYRIVELYCISNSMNFTIYHQRRFSRKKSLISIIIEICTAKSRTTRRDDWIIKKVFVSWRIF